MSAEISKVGRNEPCPCGSGRKYKQCHALKSNRLTRGQIAWIAVIATVVVGGLVLAVSTREDHARPAGVWSAEHGHYH